MIKTLGIRGHDYGKMTSSELAKAVSRDGLGSVQLALNKAILGIDSINDPMTEEGLIEIGKDFKEANVDIAVLGCYLNYAHPNKKMRQDHLRTFIKHIGYAKLLNARVLGTETGSMMEDYSYTKDNHTDSAYKIFADSLSVLLLKAEEMNVNIAVEGVWNHIIYSNERMNQLIKDMASSSLKVILDPVNLLNVNNYRDHDDMVKQSFDLFGDCILTVHSKDYRVESNEIHEVSHGSGVYDYDFLTKIVKEGPQAIDILLENADVKNIAAIQALFREGTY